MESFRDFKFAKDSVLNDCVTKGLSEKIFTGSDWVISSTLSTAKNSHSCNDPGFP